MSVVPTGSMRGEISESTNPMTENPKSGDLVKFIAGKLDQALEELSEAKAFAKGAYQTDVFQHAETLMNTEEGMRALYERASQLEDRGVFYGGPWANSSKLQPQLVSGSLKAGGVLPVVEALSELRMLAIAQGLCEGKDAEGAVVTSKEDARDFLDEVLALNLEFIFPSHTEAERIEGGPHREMSILLFKLISEELGLSSLLEDVVSEIEQICVQRPIVTQRVRKMIEMAGRIPDDDSHSESVCERLKVYTSAIDGPSELSKKFPVVADYREALREVSDNEVLKREGEAFAAAMNVTGLTCPHYAVLLRKLRSSAPELLPSALGLNDVGAAELAQNQELVLRLIRFCILPATAQSIYGFARLLEQGLLSRQEISVGLERLVELDILPDVKRKVLASRSKHDGVTANALIVAGVISVFGQPLGLGQGNNPSCQAVRAISLWAQHAQGYLLETVISASREGFIEISFEGEVLNSGELDGGLVDKIDPELDVISIILTQHLDKIYDAMMKKSVLRPEDGHKWVNPAFYGRWVPNGFCSIFNTTQTVVENFEHFMRRFFATRHPAYNDGHSLMYPNPVGILVTNSHGDYLGPHAVSIQRIEIDPHGLLRVYFFNPNNEGRQNWGNGVKPSIEGNGELEGESSLPFSQFASRLYAFHYNPYEEGEAYAVPMKLIEEIETAARESWGKAFKWSNE